MFRRRKLKTIGELVALQRQREEAWKQLELAGAAIRNMKLAIKDMTPAVTLAIASYGFTVDPELALRITKAVHEELGQRCIRLSSELYRHGVQA